MTNLCLIEIRKNILLIFHPLKEPDHKLNDTELNSKVNFNQVDIYNLNSAIIGLLPMNIIRSKYWSKKSPIVLQNIIYLGNEIIQTSSTDNLTLSYKIDESKVRKTVVLFTRTRRSKEEWFYRFVNASQLDSWRKQIHYRLEQNDTINSPKQIPLMSRKKNVLMNNNDEDHKRHMISFLKRSDRFAVPDQLPYLKPVGFVQKLLPNFQKFEQRKKRNNYQQSNNGKKSLNIRRRQGCNKRIENLMSDYKRQYCEQWVAGQNPTKMMINDGEKQIDLEEKQKQHLKKSHYKNTNGTNISHNTAISESSIQIDPNQFQHKSHPLLFFVLKYLQKMPYNTTENNIQNPILLLNIFAARSFLDFFDNEQYLRRIQTFIQKQLQKIKIPFIEHITITNLNFGDRLPEIKDIFKPWIDEHGLWSHINISYDGKLQLTLTAKLKLIRKNRINDQVSHKNTSLSHSLKINHEQNNISVKKSWRKRLWPPSHWFHSRQSTLTNKNTNYEPNHSSSHLKNIVPKINKTTIVIKFDINNLNGILLFNMPPSPSDRIWISFLDMPQMEFSATPHLGEFRVPFYKIKNKLEKKLRQIFSRYLVMPNMKDFIIPTINDYLSDSGIIKVIPSEMKLVKKRNILKI